MWSSSLSNTFQSHSLDLEKDFRKKKRLCLSCDELGQNEQQINQCRPQKSKSQKPRKSSH